MVGENSSAWYNCTVIGRKYYAAAHKEVLNLW